MAKMMSAVIGDFTLHNCLIFIILGVRDDGKHVKHQSCFCQVSLSLQRSKKHQTLPPGTNQGDFN